MAASTLDDKVVDSVTNANFKAVAEQIAFFSNQALADAMQDQRESRLLSKSIVGSLCKRIVESDVEEGVGQQLTASANLPGRETELSSANGVASLLQSAAVAFAQIIAKMAQSTPPETAVKA